MGLWVYLKTYKEIDSKIHPLLSTLTARVIAQIHVIFTSHLDYAMACWLQVLP